MNPIYLGIVVALAVLVTGEPGPEPEPPVGFHGNGAFGSNGFGHQQRRLPYGAGTPFGPNGNGYSQHGFRGQGQRGYQHGSAGAFGGRFHRSPAGFGQQGNFGVSDGFGESSYSNGIGGQNRQRGLPYGAGTFADPRFNGFQG